jgi:hypothetical protein
MAERLEIFPIVLSKARDSSELNEKPSSVESPVTNNAGLGTVIKAERKALQCTYGLTFTSRSTNYYCAGIEASSNQPILEQQIVHGKTELSRPYS